ncbi:MAG: ABC transporter ATP-binding protein [Chloroflexi bacterium]|nr:MAG: ABC transporter ATP-binding protein [Chloroflexota bacterium]
MQRSLMREVLVAELLRVEDVKKHFGGVMAVNGVSVEVGPATIVGLIGPNGAGKSTLVDLINGVYTPDTGQIFFRGRRIDGLPPHDIAHMGIGRTFQIPRVFHRLTVLENVLTPVVYRGPLSHGGRQRAMELLELVNLADKADQYAGELSGGQQKLLEFARAAMAEPTLILMDEPFNGVHPVLKATLVKSIQRVNAEEGIALLIVSHDTPVIAELCERTVVMHLGEKFLDGPTRQVLNDDRVVDIYLGSAVHATAG